MALLCATQALAFVGLRPNGAADIGTLYDTDRLPVDRVGVDTARSTTPQAISDFVYGRINGMIAPATHDHAVATESAAGFMSEADRLLLSGLDISSRSEGAIANGTWYSLASQGYTVASAQAKWPYLTTDGTLTGTHLIQTTADLDSYGVDWCALKHAMFKAIALKRRMVVSSAGGAHIIERKLQQPDGTTLDIVGESAHRWSDIGSVIRPKEGTFPTADGMLVTGVDATARISRVRFAATTGNTYTGIVVTTPGYHRVSITDCVFDYLAKATRVIPMSYQLTFARNTTWECTIGLYPDAGAAGAVHERPWIDGNEFDRGYHSLGDYAIRTADNVAVGAPVITHNQSAYHLGLYYHHDVTSGQDGTVGEISHNRIISYAYQPSIYTVGPYAWEFRVQDNQCWEGQGDQPRIVVGGVGHLDVSGNTATHSSGYLLQLKSVPYSLVLSGNTNGNGASTAHGQLYMPQSEMISSGAGFPAPGAMKLHLGPGHATAAGQIIPIEANVAYIDLVSYTPRTVVDVVSPAQPGLDADTIIQRTAGNLVLWYSNSTMTGKRYRIINKGTATINVTCPGGGLQDAAGNTVTSLPVAVHGSISVIHMFGGWRQE